MVAICPKELYFHYEASLVYLVSYYVHMTFVYTVLLQLMLWCSNWFTISFVTKWVVLLSFNSYYILDILNISVATRGVSSSSY